MPVYQDDPTTVERDGARANEVIHFVVNGLPAVSLGPDDPIWTYNGDIWEVDLIASHYTQHVLSLKTGWNLISFNVAPSGWRSADYFAQHHRRIRAGLDLRL